MGEHRIVRIALDERSIARRSIDVEHERKVAIADLLEENYFEPLDALPGPYAVTLGLEEGRLRFDIASPAHGKAAVVQLPLTSLRRIIRDYILICDSYYTAIRSAVPSQIEAIDMGRRGLHNEGAALLLQRLSEKVKIDDNTARRLFTLISILHLRR
jgi:uncharacterized protein (UPF0262 family)